MILELTQDQSDVLAEVIEMTIDQLDMDNMIALKHLQDIQKLIGEPTERVIV